MHMFAYAYLLSVLVLSGRTILGLGQSPRTLVSPGKCVHPTEMLHHVESISIVGGFKFPTAAFLGSTGSRRKKHWCEISHIRCLDQWCFLVNLRCFKSVESPMFMMNSCSSDHSFLAYWCLLSREWMGMDGNDPQ